MLTLPELGLITKATLTMDNLNKSYWTTNKEHHAHMAMRQKQNKARASKAEDWFFDKLRGNKYSWTKQARWGFRIFDFWCHELGVAIEVDGKEHDHFKDSMKDNSVWKRTRIVVIRVRNFNEEDATSAINKIYTIESWNERRLKDGLKQITT
jgi:very-short-patch-repair endonuclease